MTTRDGYTEYWTPKEILRGRHPHWTHYELLPGDLLRSDPDGTWHKEGPGLHVFGFQGIGQDELRPLRAKWLGPMLFKYEDPATAAVVLRADKED